MKKVFLALFILMFFMGTATAVSIYGIKNRTLSLGNIDGCSFVSMKGTNSMYPAIEEGDTVCYVDYKKYKEKNTLNKRDIIIYKFNGEQIVHRIIKLNEEYIITKGDNNKYEDYPITRDEVLYKVEVVLKKRNE